MAIRYTTRVRVIMPSTSFTATLAEAVRHVLGSDPNRQHLATIAVDRDAGTEKMRLNLADIRAIADRSDFPRVDEGPGHKSDGV
jgi:hypothetical protein